MVHQKFWQTEARNEQIVKKLKNEYLVASIYPVATAALVHIVNLFLDPTTKMTYYTLLDKVNRQMTFERKELLKNALLEDYKAICQQDHSNSKQVLEDDLAAHVKKATVTHFMNHSISNKRLKVSSRM